MAISEDETMKESERLKIVADRMVYLLDSVVRGRYNEEFQILAVNTYGELEIALQGISADYDEFFSFTNIEEVDKVSKYGLVNDYLLASPTLTEDQAITAVS
jgi:hypothetical protein